MNFFDELSQLARVIRDLFSSLLLFHISLTIHGNVRFSDK